MLIPRTSKTSTYFKVQGYYPNRRFTQAELTRCLAESGLRPDKYDFSPLGDYTTVLTMRCATETDIENRCSWMKQAGIDKVKVTKVTTTWDDWYYELPTPAEEKSSCPVEIPTTTASVATVDAPRSKQSAALPKKTPSRSRKISL